MNRELLQQALAEVKAARELVYEKTGLVEFNKPLGLESAIEAALSRSEWVPLAKGLPVVPEVCRKVDIWVRTVTGEIQKYTFFDGETANNFAHSFTHWMYRQDDTPAPPEAE